MKRKTNFSVLQNCINYRTINILNKFLSRWNNASAAVFMAKLLICNLREDLVFSMFSKHITLQCYGYFPRRSVKNVHYNQFCGVVSVVYTLFKRSLNSWGMYSIHHFNFDWMPVMIAPFTSYFRILFCIFLCSVISFIPLYTLMLSYFLWYFSISLHWSECHFSFASFSLFLFLYLILYILFHHCSYVLFFPVLVLQLSFVDCSCWFL